MSVHPSTWTLYRIPERLNRGVLYLLEGLWVARTVFGAPNWVRGMQRRHPSVARGVVFVLFVVVACSPSELEFPSTTTEMVIITRSPTSTSGASTTTGTMSGAPPVLADPPATVDEAFDRIATMGTLRALTAEIAADRCLPLHQAMVGEPAPIASVADLYVLAALGDAIAESDLSWDETIVIREELKSVPPGMLQDRPDGAAVTVREAAEAMTSISDNTATDHLIDLLGREVVEGALTEYGNVSPELTTPFANTREITALKVGPASGLRDPQWIDGDERARRVILEQISDITPADLPLQDWTEPIDPDLVGWFASPTDLCTLAIALIGLSGPVPEIADILAINPGVPAPAGTWDRVWFIGGSEPGLLAVWYGTESEGRRFVTVGSVVHTETSMRAEEASFLFAAARDLLAP